MIKLLYFLILTCIILSQDSLKIVAGSQIGTNPNAYLVNRLIVQNQLARDSIPLTSRYNNLEIELLEEKRVDKWNVVAHRWETILYLQNINGSSGIEAAGISQHLINKNVTNVKDFGAKGDNTDDTDAIRKALENSNGTLYFPPGVYLTKQLVITKSTEIIGAGLDLTTLKLKKTEIGGINEDFISVINKPNSNLTLTDITIDANGPNQLGSNPWALGINFTSSGLLNIRYSKVINGKNNGVYVYGSKGVQIHNSYFDQSLEKDSLNDCIIIIRTPNCNISNNFIRNGLGGIRLLYFCNNSIISNNFIEGGYGDVGITVALSTNVNINNNICRGAFNNGIEVKALWRSSIIGNICEQQLNRYGIQAGRWQIPRSVLKLDSINGQLITRDTLDNVLIYPEIDYSSQDLVISNNITRNNGGAGIELQNVIRTVVSGNTVSNNQLKENDNYGLGISNSDVYVNGNHFENSIKQNLSIQFGPRTYKEKIGKNFHNGGRKISQPSLGCKDLNTDPFGFFDSSFMLTSGTLVKDESSSSGYARQITNPYTNGNVTTIREIQVPGNLMDYLIRVSFKNPKNEQSLDSIRIVFNLYNDSVWVQTVEDINLEPKDVYQYHNKLVVNNLSYNKIRVEIQTHIGDLGKINIGEINVLIANEMY